MAKKEMLNFGGKSKLNPLPVRIFLTTLNVVLGYLGIKLLLGLGLIDWIQSLFAFMFAVIIALQIGLKRYTNLSNLKEFGIMEWIGTFTALIMLAFSIVNLTGIPIPALNQVVGTIFLLGAVVITIDIWV
jgi:hypothetical protein